MEIVTIYTKADEERFLRLKRRTSGKWTFLVSGEWSQSPYHQGNISFYIRSSDDNRYWALMSGGFPRRIIAVADAPEDTRLEIAGGEMMRMVRAQDGDYIDLVHESGDIDFEAFWKTYKAK